MKWFQGGLAFKAHRLSYQSTLGLKAIKKEKKQLSIRTTKEMDRSAKIAVWLVFGV